MSLADAQWPWCPPSPAPSAVDLTTPLTLDECKALAVAVLASPVLPDPDYVTEIYAVNLSGFVIAAGRGLHCSQLLAEAATGGVPVVADGRTLSESEVDSAVGELAVGVASLVSLLFLDERIAALPAATDSDRNEARGLRMLGFKSLTTDWETTALCAQALAGLWGQIASRV